MRAGLQPADFPPADRLHAAKIKAPAGGITFTPLASGGARDTAASFELAR
jgi:hypothetical protein